MEVTKELAAYTESLHGSIISIYFLKLSLSFQLLRIIQEMLPGASAKTLRAFSTSAFLLEVEGFANADVLRGTAFGVAVTPSVSAVIAVLRFLRLTWWCQLTLRPWSSSYKATSCM